MVRQKEDRRSAAEHFDVEGRGISSFASDEHGLRAFLAAIVSSSTDGIVGKTLDGIIWSWNAGAEALFGYSTSEAIGRSILMLIPDDRRAEEEEILSRIRHGEGVPNFDTVRVRKGGTLVEVSITVSPIRDAQGTVIGASKIARDVGERKRAERALAEKERALRESDRRKDEFLAMLAHELRNPLAPIRTGLTLLREAGDDPAVVARVYDALERQSLQLTRLVDDLMDVSRITRGKLELRPETVDLATIVEHAIEASRPSIDGGGHQLEVRLPTSPVVLHADAARLSQVLSNLLNNAAKYTPEPGVIRLCVECEADDVVLRVIDTGVGIPALELERVFEPFTQLPAGADRVSAGLGVGLTLVKRLVEMHGGRVTAHSSGVGKGAEMAVYLPLSASSTRESQAEQRPARRGHLDSLHIVVADDNRDAGEALGALLEALGHQVTLAFDGQHALEVVRKTRPDLVILDVGMPGLDGLEVARSLRAEPWGQQLFLAALTGWGRPSDRERTAAAGFDCHLVKPASRDSLDDVINRASARATAL